MMPTCGFCARYIIWGPEMWRQREDLSPSPLWLKFPSGEACSAFFFCLNVILPPQRWHLQHEHRLWGLATREGKKMRTTLGTPAPPARGSLLRTRLTPKHDADQPDWVLTEQTGHSLLQLLGELHHLGGERHAGLHHHQVPGAQAVSVALGALGGLLPGVVLHRDICSVLNQGLLEKAETCDPSGLPSKHY